MIGWLGGVRCLDCAGFVSRSALAQRSLGFGACTRIRTRDQLIKSQLLYQLSYAGARAILSSHLRSLRYSVNLSITPLNRQPARR